jgi:hypothetical protein
MRFLKAKNIRTAKIDRQLLVVKQSVMKLTIHLQLVLKLKRAWIYALSEM